MDWGIECMRYEVSRPGLMLPFRLAISPYRLASPLANLRVPT